VFPLSLRPNCVPSFFCHLLEVVLRGQVVQELGQVRGMAGSYESLGRSTLTSTQNVFRHSLLAQRAKHPFICIRISGPHNTLWRLRSALRVAEIHANVEAHREIHAF